MTLPADTISCVIDTGNPERRLYKAVMLMDGTTDRRPGANPFLSAEFRSRLSDLDATHVVMGRTTPDWHGVILVINGNSDGWRDRHHQVVSILIGKINANPATVSVDLSYRHLAPGMNRQLVTTN